MPISASRVLASPCLLPTFASQSFFTPGAPTQRSKCDRGAAVLTDRGDSSPPSQQGARLPQLTGEAQQEARPPGRSSLATGCPCAAGAPALGDLSCQSGATQLLRARQGPLCPLEPEWRPRPCTAHAAPPYPPEAVQETLALYRVGEPSRLLHDPCPTHFTGSRAGSAQERSPGGLRAPRLWTPTPTSPHGQTSWAGPPQRLQDPPDPTFRPKSGPRMPTAGGRTNGSPRAL